MRYLISLTTIGIGLALAFGLVFTLDKTEPVRAQQLFLPILGSSCDQAPFNSPTSATTNLDETWADWGAYCELTPTWVITNVITPSLDGNALQCALTGGSPYSNVHCYRNLLAQPEATAFTLTVPFQFTPTTTCNNAGGVTSTVQALEFSLSKWHDGRRYEMALQWANVVTDGPHWRYWDPSPSSPLWLPISPTINQCLTAGVWYTLTLEGEIANEQMYYRAFTITDTRHTLNFTAPYTVTTDTNKLAVAVQLDGNVEQTPYTVTIDAVTLKRTPVCSVLYDGGNGWVVDTCTDVSGVPTMTVTLNSAAPREAALVRVYHQSSGWPGVPQVAVFYADGFVRLKPNADPLPPIPFGTSFVLGPAYWDNTYHHNPRLSRFDINTAWLANGPLRLRAEGTNAAFNVAYDLTLPPARDWQTRVHVSQTYTATAPITISPTRAAQYEGFKLAQFSSMYISESGPCDFGYTDCHDSNGARFIGDDLARHQMAFSQIAPSAWVFTNPLPLGSVWLDALHTDDESWQGNTPNTRIAVDVLPLTYTLTPQGWVSATTDPNQDNMGLWVHDDGPASQAWSVGQSGQTGYWLIAQDNPPEPWADINLRAGLTIEDFESGHTCYPVFTPTVTASVGLISGYVGNALQLDYDLGSINRDWAQIRCDFNPPLDLSAYDHLRFDWRGDPASANSLEVGVVITSAGQEYIFGRGYHHATQHGAWGQLVIPFQFLPLWGTGPAFTSTQVSAIFVSVVKDVVDDTGGAGRLALDNLSAFNALTRTRPVTFETVTGNAQASLAALNWLAAQQYSQTGLLKSWSEETTCTAHTYDQALALLAFSHAGRWAEADDLVLALSTTQNVDGSWHKSYQCDSTATPPPCVHCELWEGDIAWAIYALGRYHALGGTLSEADTARMAGANWLNTRVALDGCLVITHTEGTLDAWWALQSVGPTYAYTATQLETCLLTEYWDEAMKRFKSGRGEYDYHPFLDNQTWGAAFLKAIGREGDALSALSYAWETLRLPAPGGQLFGFDGQGGPWAVWNEGTGQYIASGGTGANDLLIELLAQQRADGALPGSPTDFNGGGV